MKEIFYTLIFVTITTQAMNSTHNEHTKLNFSEKDELVAICCKRRLFVNGQRVASIMYNIAGSSTENQFVCLSKLWVPEQERRKGYATRLVISTLTEIKSKLNKDCFAVHATDVIGDAQHFFHRLGFEGPHDVTLSACLHYTPERIAQQEMLLEQLMAKNAEKK